MVNCLNFGNPEHPEVMWQLSETVDGMTEALDASVCPASVATSACTTSPRATDIDPTPVIGVLGMVDRLDRRPPGVTLVDGGRLVLVGPTVPELSGTLWAATQGHRGRGELPPIDLEPVALTADKVRELVAAGLVLGAHDVGSGGVGVALAEMIVRSGVGVTAARIPDHAHLFSESAGRAVLCIDAEQSRVVFDVLDGAGVPYSRIGVAGGDRFTVKGLLDLGVDELRSSWRNRLPDALGAGTTQG